MLRETINRRLLSMYVVDLVESKTTVKRNYLDTGKITQSEYDALLKYDPTKDSGAKYFDWIVKQFVIAKTKYSIERPTILWFVEKNLPVFHNALRLNLLKPDERDINQYSYEEFEEKIRNLGMKTFNGVGIKFSDLEDGVDYEIVEQNARAVVIKILTYKASYQLGSDTWCVRNSESTWNTYKRQGSIFYFVLNLNEQSSKTNRVWAISFNEALYKAGYFSYVSVFDGLNHDISEKKSRQYFTTELGLKFNYNKPVQAFFSSKEERLAFILKSDLYKNMVANPTNRDDFDYALGVIINFDDMLSDELRTELESIIAKDSTTSLRYAQTVLHSPFRLGEKAIAEGPPSNAYSYLKEFGYTQPNPAIISRVAEFPQTAYQYAKFRHKPFPEGEDAIAEDPETAYEYAQVVLKGRFPKGENIIAKDSYYALLYAVGVLKGRFSKGENAIAKQPTYAVQYAEILNSRFPEAETRIASSALDSFKYAYIVLDGRFPEGEKAIAQNANVALRYAKHVMRGRFPEGESIIALYPDLSKEYVDFLKINEIPIPDVFKKYESVIVINKFFNLCESKSSVKRLYLNTGKITQEEFDKLLDFDPSNDFKFLEWIVGQYLATIDFYHGDKEVAWKHMFENEISNTLKDFDMLVRNKVLTGNAANIKNYKWYDLVKAVKELSVDIKKFGDVEIDFGRLVEDQDYVIEEISNRAVAIKIITYAASKQLGSHSWCIQNQESYFRSYKQRGIYFYFIINLKELNSNTDRVWALAFNKLMYDKNPIGNYLEVIDGRNNVDYDNRNMPVDIAVKYLRNLGLTYNFEKAIKYKLRSDEEKSAEVKVEVDKYIDAAKNGDSQDIAVIVNSLLPMYPFVLSNNDYRNKIENILATDAQYSYEYAKDILKGRFEKGEQIISKSAEYSYLYALNVLKGRFEKGENIISKNARYSYEYARNVLKDRFEKGEQIISKNARYSYLYALNVLKGRFEKGEQVISTDASYSYYYARDVLEGRFEKGEQVISTDASYSYLYALNVLKGRFEKGEKIISKDAKYSYEYDRHINSVAQENRSNAVEATRRFFTSV